MGVSSKVACEHGPKGGEKEIKALLVGVLALGCSYEPSRQTVGFDVAPTANQMWRGPAPVQLSPDALAAAPDVLVMAAPDALAAAPDAHASDTLAAAPDAGWPTCVVWGSLWIASKGSCVELSTIRCYVGHFGSSGDPTVTTPCQSTDWYDGAKWQTIPLYLVPSCSQCPKFDGDAL